MTKKTNCFLKISSNVINLDEDGRPEGEVEKDELCVAGALNAEGDAITLSYKEEREGSSVLCKITARGDEVKVSRRGDVISDMLFSPGKIHKSVYKVPPFSFDMEISALKIENGLKRDGGVLSLLYGMTVGGAKKRCRMKIEAFLDNE